MQVVKYPGSAVTWFAISDPNSHFTDILVEDITDPNNPVDLTGSLIAYGSNPYFQEYLQLGGAASTSLRVRGVMDSCEPGQLDLYAGWSCGTYPSDPQTGTFSGGEICSTVYRPVQVEREPAGLQAAFRTQPTEVQLCDTVEYEVIVKSTRNGPTYDHILDMFFPYEGLELIPGSFYLAYPDTLPPPTNPSATTGAYINIPDPVAGATTPDGISYVYDFSRADIHAALGASAFLDGGGRPLLPGVTVPEDNMNTFALRFKVATDCEYISGGRIKVQLDGKDRCDNRLIG